jgi:hypothetical protein
MTARLGQDAFVRPALPPDEGVRGYKNLGMVIGIAIAKTRRDLLDNLGSPKLPLAVWSILTSLPRPKS